jgi:hypothetical protein
VCTGITSKDELLFIPTTVVSNFPLMGVVVHLNHRYVEATISSLVLPCLMLPSLLSYPSSRTSTMERHTLCSWQNCRIYERYWTLQRTVSTFCCTVHLFSPHRPRVPESVLYPSPLLQVFNKEGALQPCYGADLFGYFISLRYGPFRTHCLLWKVLCPACAKPPLPFWPAPVKLPVSSYG